MPAKRMKLTLSRAQVEKVNAWAFFNMGEAMSEREAEIYEGIHFQCEKALKFYDERRSTHPKDQTK